VSWEPPLDPGNLMTAPFKVTNVGELPVYDVTFLCDLGPMSTDKLIMEDGPKISIKRNPVPKLAPSTSTTTFCGFPLRIQGMHELAGSIEVIVSYRTIFLPTRFNDTFKFRTVRGSDGTLRWLDASSSEPD
jgi:hypothetical protein